MTDVERIAKGLTEPQRRLLMALPDNGKDATCFWNLEYRNYRGAMASWRALVRKGLSGTFGEASPLGLAVRSYLMEQSHD